MTAPLRTLIITAGIALLLLGSAACETHVRESILSTTVEGREIRAVIDGPAFMAPKADGATISFTGHKVTVEKTRVLLDGAELAPLASNATKIVVSVSAGQLSITADGAHLRWAIPAAPHLR